MASSSCSGTVDNFWSRDDIRVHTFGVHPKAVEVLAEGSVRGKPTRTAILIGRHSSIDYTRPSSHPRRTAIRAGTPATGASGADLGQHLSCSGLGNRRIGSQGPPCVDEVPLAARQPMPPTVLNGSAANVGGAGAGADRRLTQEAGRFFYWMDRGEQVSLAAFPASERT